MAQHEALDEGADDARAAVRSELASAEATLRVAETQLAAAQSAHSDVAARRGALTLSLGEETRRVDRLGAELANVERERDALRAADIGDAERRTVVETAERTHEIHENSQDEVHAAEEAHIAARDVETRLRGPLAESEAEARGLEAEARTLQKLLGSPGEGGYAPIVDSLQVARGYETALGAALGDDLDASADESAPAHWSRLPGDGADPALPEGVEPLARSVEAPPALQRRLAQIGIVSRAAGGDLAAKLRPGQRLVSLEGDFWRWDGFVAAAEAPTPAARRLAERNRFGDLARRAEAARQNAEALRLEAHAAQATTQVAAQRETSAKQRLRIAAIERDAARERVAGVEKRRVQVVSRLAALDEAADRARGSHEEAIERRSTAEAALVELSADSESAAVLTEARGEATEARTAFTEAKSNAQTLEREIESRIARRAGLTRDLRSWEERAEGARARIQEFDARGETAMQEREQLLEAPAEFDRQRRGLMREIEAAEAARKIAADARALGDVALAEADRIARAALEVMSAARESRAASEQRLAAAAQRRAQTLQQIADELETEPHGLPEIAGLKSGETPPEIDYVQRKRDSLKQERERLGAVNLRAEDELTDIETSRDKMVSERDDLTEAIKRLRAAIQSLNQEGRERLVAAFDVVNGHFKQLFATLFEGGEAELQLVESEDPLHAGLELLARPPGKKPQTLTLLSGGEQALTAMALIFAVFLTNPSPICVLDEVDAPLDDYNVERFCDLLDEMCKRSDTRFVAITHNPVTMARMDRLFGVTMAERGVSQIVSVDLATAERFLEAS